jgi:hypothetical protein
MENKGNTDVDRVVVWQLLSRDDVKQSRDSDDMVEHKW